MTTPKFHPGTFVSKSSGSDWVGRVVGNYNTNLTSEGVAVESFAHPGSVQIYPVKALHAVREPEITMDKATLLHTLRNPHGLSENHVRAARLQAADMIEVLFGDGWPIP